MRSGAFACAVILVTGSCLGGGSTPPATPSPVAAPAATAESTAAATPIGLTGVIRGLDLRNGAFALAARSGSYQIRIDGRTRVWNGGTQVRAASLKDGQAVAIRGYDYGSHVVALTISITR